MKRLICATVVATWLLGGAAASAQPDEGAKLVARELMAKGRGQREAGDLAGALESFSKAHAIMHVPTTLLEVARVQVDSGRWVEALELLRELPSMPPTEGEPAPFTRARSDAQELGQQLEPHVPSIRVDVSGAPQGPKPLVTLDGVPRPECVSGCRVNPGPHLVAARTERVFAEEQLHVAEGERQVLELVFSPLATPPPSDSGPGAAEPETRPRAGAAARPIPLATWVAGGVSLAGFTAGAVLGVTAVSQRNDLRDGCAPHCSTDDVDRVRRQAVLANVAFGVGLSAAALAVVSYVMAPRPGAAAASSLSLAAGPETDGHGGRLTLGGQF